MRRGTGWGLGAAAALLLLASGILVLRLLPYENPGAKRMAANFLNLIRAGKLEGAYGLTARNGYVGLSLEAFAQNSDVALVRDSAVASPSMRVYPLQTRWNRLGRLLRGREVEPEALSIECGYELPFAIHLVRRAGAWLVFSFGAHAG